MSVNPFLDGLLQEEISLLMQFDLSSTQTGIKVHSSARQEAILAARRLHEKGLVTQVDGGYLTPLGRETTEYLDNALRILKSRHH